MRRAYDYIINNNDKTTVAQALLATTGNLNKPRRTMEEICELLEKEEGDDSDSSEDDEEEPEAEKGRGVSITSNSRRETTTIATTNKGQQQLLPEGWILRYKKTHLSSGKSNARYIHEKSGILVKSVAEVRRIYQHHFTTGSTFWEAREATRYLKYDEVWSMDRILKKLKTTETSEVEESSEFTLTIKKQGKLGLFFDKEQRGASVFIRKEGWKAGRRIIGINDDDVREDSRKKIVQKLKDSIRPLRLKFSRGGLEEDGEGSNSSSNSSKEEED